MKGADRLEHPRVAAQFIRSPSAGDQQTVIGSGIHFRKGEVRRCRDSVLSFIYGTLLRAAQGTFSAPSSRNRMTGYHSSRSSNSASTKQATLFPLRRKAFPSVIAFRESANFFI